MCLVSARRAPAGSSYGAENVQSVMAEVASRGLDAERCIKGKIHLGDTSLSMSEC